MKVKELIEALQKVKNQDAVVIFFDGEINQWELYLKEPHNLFETDLTSGKWDGEKVTSHRYKSIAIELEGIVH